MNNVFISILIGSAAGLVDIIPMIIKKLDRLFILSAFSMWVSVGILSWNLTLVKIPALNSLLFALLVFAPLSFLVYRLDRAAMIQVCVTMVVLGLLTGFIPALIAG